MARKLYKPTVDLGSYGSGVTESQVNALLSTKANTTDLVTINNTLNNKADTTLLADKLSVTDANTLLSGKANVTHTHATSDVTGLNSSIDNRVAALGLSGWGTDFTDVTASRAFGVQYPAHTKNIIINLTMTCSGGGSGRYNVYLNGNLAGVISPIEYQGGGGTYTGSDSFVIPANHTYEIRNDAGAFGTLSITKWSELR